ncbi:MAG: flagellar export chaperone FliS [Halothiobacillaceae bacterium]|jgi:flagellar protein FliS|nr:flagellar export chaperone FliS [Halothiobacillaceae bacterium]MDY0049667.1 flagellar export chaperone FliS [Halothiobacillaceae bacterium]
MSQTDSIENIKDAGSQILQDDLTNASPYELVQTLLESAQARLDIARDAMSAGDNTTKGERISEVIVLVGLLQGSLDMKSGTDLAEKLDTLYTHMQQRLLESSANNDVAVLDQVRELLSKIKDAWDGIPEDART